MKMRITFDTYTEMLPLADMKRHRFQRNRHPKKQIERLAMLMREHGVRHPISMVKATGEIAFGHGRREAAILNGWAEYPVIYQEFKSEEEEYAVVQSDNAIASWAELDFGGILDDIKNLPKFDLDLLGIKNFKPPELVEAEKKKSEESLSSEQKELINVAWSEWSSQLVDTVAKLHPLVFAQSFNKAFLKIEFLRALFLNEDISRSATLGYHTHRMSCSGDGDNGSIIDLLQLVADQPKKAERIRFALADKPSIEKLVTVAGVAMAGHKAPLDFPAKLAKQIYNEFAKDGHVLDPCHGWGGRYLGFALSDARTYTGVDPSDLTHRGLREMHDDLLSIHGKDATFIQSPFEDVVVHQNHFALAFTSPPYFDRERYLGGDQAHSRYKTYDQFIDGFYTAMFEKVFIALKDGGHFCLQVGIQKYDLDKQALKIADKVGFKFVEKRETEMTKVGASMDDEPKEILLVFKKE